MEVLFLLVFAEALLLKSILYKDLFLFAMEDRVYHYFYAKKLKFVKTDSNDIYFVLLHSPEAPPFFNSS